MSPETVTAQLRQSAPRAAAIWQSWLELAPDVPEDREETLAAFARFFIIDSDRANDHPRIVGSALSAVAAALRA
jgi:hypothetical protein